jgi:dTDP-4-amino-4,6-dideoxygalactose transaminase
MFSEKDKVLFDAAMDYPVFLSEDEVTQRAMRYAQQISGETEAQLSEVCQNGWIAGYLLVCEFAQEDEELIKEQANVITSSSRSKALQLVTSLLKRALAKQVM